MWDFRGSPVVKTPCFHCRGYGLDPWSGNQDPTCHTAWPKKNPQTSKQTKNKQNQHIFNVYNLKLVGKYMSVIRLASAIHEVNLQMFKLVLEKAEKPEVKLPISIGSSKKQESSRKTSISALLTMPKPLTVWITINCGKFFKRWAYQTI